MAIWFESGRGTGLEQKVESMQVEHAQVDGVAKERRALKVTAAVKTGDIVYKARNKPAYVVKFAYG